MQPTLTSDRYNATVPATANLGKRQRQKAATHADLVQAAMACFAELGYIETTIADITGRAGVAKGTFYVHFDSKEALLDEELVAFNAGFIAQLQTHTQAIDRAHLHTGMQTIAGAFLDYWMDNQAFIKIYAQRAAGGLRPESLYEGVNPATFAFVRMWLSSYAQSDVEMSDADLDLVVHGVLAMWLRLGLRYVFAGDVRRDTYIQLLTGMSIGAVAAIVPGIDVPV